MDVIKDILFEKNNLLFKGKSNIWKKSDNWIRIMEHEEESIQKNLILSQIYYLRLVSRLEYEDAEKACMYFEKIPIECYTDEIIIDYVCSLKLCYRFEKVISLLNMVMKTSPWFTLKHFCLNELTDSSMVADGVITKEEYIEYKEQLIELLDKEKKIIEATIP